MAAKKYLSFGLSSGEIPSELILAAGSVLSSYRVFCVDWPTYTRSVSSVNSVDEILASI